MNITSLQVRCVRVPMPEPHRTASGTVALSPQPLEVREGLAYPGEAPGSGVEFDERAVQRYLT